MTEGSKPRRFDLYPDDFIAAVAGEMTPAELGVYWMICLLHYSRRKAIPYDLDWLRRKFVPSKGNRVIKDIIEGLIASGRVYREGDEIGVRRCRDEVERATRRVREAVESGVRGGRPSKKNNGVDKGSGFFEKKLSPIIQQPSPSSVVATEPNGSSAPKRALSRDAMFAIWWLAYPHKVGKGEARRKFDIAIRAGIEFDTLVAGVERYKRTKPEERQWVNPATWLHQDRWLDEPAPSLVVDNPEPDQTPTAEDWRCRMDYQRDKGKWAESQWGPPPAHPDCTGPYDLLAEYGFRSPRARLGGNC